MSNFEYGLKLTCTACAVRFYDLRRSPAVCPKCGEEQPRAKPRMATRVAPVLRGPGAAWHGRVPPIVTAIIPEPAPIETDPLDEVEEEEENEDDGLTVKHDD